MSDIKESVSFFVRATASDLHLRISFDNQEIFAQEIPTENIKIEHRFDDATEIDHVLEIEMQGKKSEHTRIDEAGKIVEDRCIEISEFEIGGIKLNYVLTETAIYEHDTNGTTEKRQDRFFGTMGCNGTVRLRFSSPVYLWLLEHL